MCPCFTLRLLRYLPAGLCDLMKLLLADSRRTSPSRLSFRASRQVASDAAMRLHLRLLLLVATAAARSVIPESQQHDDHLVYTSLGAIRGTQLEFDGTQMSAYLGIPFGKPPVGARRFGVPEMVEPWEGEFQATKPAKTCFLTVDNSYPQFPGAEMWNPPNEITEDCLQLNIWVPPDHDGNVMVWIFGGGFFSGSPSLDLYNGSALAVRKKTIVVNINYRLGPFGFMYLGADSEIPGNMGLLDQQLALEWVNKHIGAFGGDPRRVTLFGESAGSASCTSHMFAPGSHKFFNKLIGYSGSIINPWATRSPEALLESSLRLAKSVNCSRSEPSAIRRCLETVPNHILQIEADKITYENGLPLSLPFVPVQSDKNFFKGNVIEKVRRRDFKKDMSAILGTVSDEGTYWLPYYIPAFIFNHTISSEDPFNQALISKDQYLTSIDAFMPYFDNSPLVKNAMINAYREMDKGKSPAEQFRDGVGRFLGDYFFTCSTIEFADIIADHLHGGVYMYYFTQRSSANPWPKWMGVMHGYEIEYSFGQPFLRPNLYSKETLEAEQTFSQMIMDMWLNFAVKGFPVKGWPRYNRIERRALELNEQTTNGDFHLVDDVHGSFCRLIDEGKTLAGHVIDCRARRTQVAAAAIYDANSSSMTSLASVLISLGLLLLQ